MEVEIEMTGKIAAIVAAAALIASVGAASAQPKRHAPRVDQWQAPYAQSQAAYTDTYYNRDYWAGVAPAGRPEPRDPLGGTVFEGVAPY
jgi:hypothetical protein